MSIGTRKNLAGANCSKNLCTVATEEYLGISDSCNLVKTKGTSE